MMTNSTEDMQRIRRKRVARLLIAGCAIYLAFLLFKGVNFLRNSRSIATADRSIQQVVASEELILELTPELKKLSNSVLNLRLPDHHSRELFSESVALVDLDQSGQSQQIEHDPIINVHRQEILAGNEHTLGHDEIVLWRRLLQSVLFFENAKFYFIKGHFPDGSLDYFESEVGFSGLAYTREGEWRGLHGEQKVIWRRDNPSAGSQPKWRIIGWHTEHFESENSPQLLFSERLSYVLPDPLQRQRATKTIHQALLKPFLTETKLPVKYYTPYFSPDSLSRHPSLSVVDIDQDGFDDLYVMSRWGKNMLFRNQRDGTFQEQAADWGLDVEGHCTCAIFADFDNDADLDLMLGRSLRRSMYLVNENGRYVDRTDDLISSPLPFLVTSLSSTDFNGDGLLDVYLCTYSASLLTERLNEEPVDNNAKAWPDEFLTPAEARKLRELSKDAHRILRQVGPPNLLLVNGGNGRFEKAQVSEQVELWRSSLQATWSDFDDDGDPDVYVANDFAPDNLFRNDDGAGFTDISELLGKANMGAGMGASFADYDNDGRQDIYVSNMYSKAGRRIAAQVSKINPQYLRFAEGNFLFRNTGDRFQNVAGLEAPALLVAKAGWSWGGQFVDVDNDTDLDLYVGSGYYTVPEELASGVDL